MTSAADVIGGAEALLLDFDGPITVLMPPPSNAEAARRARSALAAVDLPREVAQTTDHLTVLRFTVERFPERLSEVERACTEAEVACARTSEPSPVIHELLTGASQRRIPVAVVSNNSEAAVRTFLERHDMTTAIAAFACRTAETAARMKPDPYLLLAAAQSVRVCPPRCVLVGDSVSDVQAGQRAGVPVVGFAKTLRRGAELAKAGAVALLEPDGSRK